MVHFLLEHGANLNLTARCAAPVSSSTSTVLAVARSSSTSTNKELQEGNIDFTNFFYFFFKKAGAVGKSWHISSSKVDNMQHKK